MDCARDGNASLSNTTLYWAFHGGLICSTTLSCKAVFWLKDKSRSFFISILKITIKATFYYTLNNDTALQDDAMGAKINDSTTAINI